ncbi:MAG: hypothetical protein ABIB46_02735 [bacterium]
MNEKEFIYNMKIKIFEEADKKEISITFLCKRLYVSRKWFYKWKRRRDKNGDEGLKTKTRAKPKMPNKVPKGFEEKIMEFIQKLSYLMSVKNRSRSHKKSCWTYRNL